MSKRKIRKLKFGTEVPELEQSVVLEVKTKCPNKWKLVDLETGEEYIGTVPGEHHMFWRKVKG
jgi:D-lyxose ketol-isomerase